VLKWEAIIAADGDDFSNIDDRTPKSRNLIIKTAQRLVAVIEEDCALFTDGRSLSQRRDGDVSYTGYTHQRNWKDERYRWTQNSGDGRRPVLQKRPRPHLFHLGNACIAELVLDLTMPVRTVYIKFIIVMRRWI